MLFYEDTCTRFEKCPSELDISHSFIRIFEINSKILALVGRNTKVNFVFLTRLFVSLKRQQITLQKNELTRTYRSYCCWRYE